MHGWIYLRPVAAHLTPINIFQGGPPLFFFYAGLAFCAAIALGLIARNYKTVDQYGVAAA